MNKMRRVDLHTHILPGIDDGARDMQESIEMAKIAAEEGITDIVCTPHLIADYDAGIRLAEERRAELSAQLARQNIPVRLHKGYEVFLNQCFLDYRTPEKLTIGHSNHILVEMNFEQMPEDFDEFLHLMRVSKLMPILAHPERYRFLWKDFGLCKSMRERGILFQMNAGSILGMYGPMAQKMAKKMLKRGMVDLIGTDAHSTQKRAPWIRESLEFCEKKFGVETVKVIHQNSMALIVTEGNGKE